MYTVYSNQVIETYADASMRYLFSEEKRSKNWRNIWVAIAEAEYELGLSVRYDQVHRMRTHQNTIDFERLSELKAIMGDTLSAHRKAFAEQCAVSERCIQVYVPDDFVVNNSRLLILYEALGLVEKQLINVVIALKEFTEDYGNTLVKAAFMSESKSTLGEFAVEWLQDAAVDLNRISAMRSQYRLLGLIRHAASRSEHIGLTEHSERDIRALESSLSRKLGFGDKYAAYGSQAYLRKLNRIIAEMLADIGDNYIRFAGEVQLLMQDGDLGWASTKNSSSKTESTGHFIGRGSGISRLVESSLPHASITPLTPLANEAENRNAEWDTVTPEAFIAISAVMRIYVEEIRSIGPAHELTFPPLYRIVKEAVARGSDRGAVTRRLQGQLNALRNDFSGRALTERLLESLSREQEFMMTFEELNAIVMREQETYAAESHVQWFIRNEVEPLLEGCRADSELSAEYLT